MSSPATPMTAAEAVKAFDKLALKIGTKARWSVYLRDFRNDASLSASFYPSESYSLGAIFSVSAETFEDLLAKSQAAWAEHSEQHTRDTIRNMALAFIRLTDEYGSCSDQMLSVEFYASDVKRLGEQACAKAAEMAARGPFSIVATTGANAIAA